MPFKLLTACLLALLVAADAHGADAQEIWATKVQPLFDVQCVKCHGPIEQKSGLELDHPEAIFKGGDEGKVVVPGKPAESRLYTYLTADADPHMPPKKQLAPQEIDLVRQWITALGSDSSSKKERSSKRDFTSITDAVNTYILEGWQERNVKPAPSLEDREWCRRVYLDLVGRIPSQQEADAFASSRSKSKRAELVDQLLASAEYPVRMRELWDVYLMGRVKRDNHEDRRKNSGWWTFLENSFRANRPWNETVREILVARPATPEDKGSHWFLFERRDNHQAIAEAVSPIVYGTRIDCAQCHDHPLAREIKQGHYWGLVAAFNRSKNVKDEGVAESAIGGYVNFTNLKKESQPAMVALLTGKTLPETWPAGDKKEEDSDENYLDPKAKVRVPKNSRREAFAEAATRDNPLLARAFVNRTWATLLGRGLIHPADEMNARNVPNHPELLDWLAEDFATNGHDVKRFIRGIVLSRPYALSHGDRPPDSFAAALERPLTGEQLARSWRVAAGAEKDDDNLRRKAVSAIPDVLPKDYNATFQQAQFLENSRPLTQILSPAPGNTAEKLLAAKSEKEQVKLAFAAALGRAPDREELAAAVEFLRERKEPAAATRDLLWALMTSAEFLTMP
ncbi:MAG TPA: DUF1549 domain-containing protein [Methylomirabilota bacterium]|nr:DUF1549 domain-containing protein [Methylomirabilota bacterium]